MQFCLAMGLFNATSDLCWFGVRYNHKPYRSHLLSQPTKLSCGGTTLVISLYPITSCGLEKTKAQFLFGVRGIDLLPETGIDFGAHLATSSQVSQLTHECRNTLMKIILIGEQKHSHMQESTVGLGFTKKTYIII